MLHHMHRHRRPILWFIIIVVVLSFGILGTFDMWSPNSGDQGDARVLADVDGEAVTVEDFNVALGQEARRMSPNGDVDLDALRENGTMSRVLDALIQRAFLAREVRENRMDFAQDLIESEFRKESIFQNEDGEFDPELFKQWVSENETRVNWNIVYDDIKNELTRALILNRVTASARVLDAELERQFAEMYTELQIKYAAIEPEVEPTEADIQKEYEENPERYQKPEERDIVFAMLSIAPTAPEAGADPAAELPAEERERLLALAREFAGDAREKGNLTAAAAEVGVPVFHANGISIRSTAIGNVPAEDLYKFRQGVGNVAANDVSEVIEAAKNVYVVQVTALREESLEPLDAVRDKVKQAATRTLKSTDDYRDRVTALCDRIKAEVGSLSELQEKFPELAIEIQESKPFTVREFRYDGGLYLNPRDIYAAVGAGDPGAFGGPLQDFTGKQFFIELVSKTPPTEEQAEEKAELRDMLAMQTERGRLADYLAYLKEQGIAAGLATLNNAAIAEITGITLQATAAEDVADGAQTSE